METIGKRSTDPLYSVWKSMRSRCNNRNTDNYKYYGGRGIKVCQRWDSFENFKQDMGDRPEGYTLDREDNDADYCPTNCKWSTRSDQKVNSRPSHKSISKVRGISWNSADNVWLVRIYRNGQCHYGGRHKNLEDAEKALSLLKEEIA